MIPDYKLEPDYVYEKEQPDVYEIQCPEEQFISCCQWMDRDELLRHYQKLHPEYGATDKEAIEIIFEQERQRRYSGE
jgi:hypothetical protein